MFFRQRELEVHGGQEGKDVGLQDSDEDFKKGEHDRQQHCPHPEKRLQVTGVEEEKVGGGEKQHQQEVPHHHVHQKTKGEGDGSQHERGDKLDRRDDQIQRQRHTGRKQRVFEKRPGVFFHTGVNKRQVGGDGQHQGHANHTGARDIEPGYHPGEVHKQHQEKDAGDEGEETLAVFLTQHVDGNPASHQVQRHFDHALEASGNDRHLAGTEVEDEEDRQHGEQSDQNDPVHFENGAFE